MSEPAGRSEEAAAVERDRALTHAAAVASRERIVEAAAALAGDRQTSMVEVAAAAGVGRSTLYRHFPSRQALERALQQRKLERFAAPPVPTGQVATLPFRAPGQLGRGALPLEVTHVLDEVPPHLVPDQLVAEARRAAGVPVALSGGDCFDFVENGDGAWFAIPTPPALVRTRPASALQHSAPFARSTPAYFFGSKSLCTTLSSRAARKGWRARTPKAARPPQPRTPSSPSSARSSTFSAATNFVRLIHRDGARLMEEASVDESVEEVRSSSRNSYPRRSPRARGGSRAKSRERSGARSNRPGGLDGLGKRSRRRASRSAR